MNMPRRIVAGTCVLAALTSGLAFLYDNSRGIDPATHDEVLTQFERLQKYESMQSQAVLQLRTGRARNYDGLVALEPAIEQTFDRVSELITSTDDPRALAIDAQIRAYRTDHLAKYDLIERFKRENAVIHNSLRYLSFENEHFETAAVDADTATLRSLIEDIIRNGMTLAATQSESSRILLSEQLEEMRSAITGATGDLAGHLEMTTRHAEIVLRTNQHLSQIIDDIVSWEADARIAGLKQEWQAFHDAARETALLYRNLMVALAALLIGSTTVFLFRIAAAGNRIRMLNRSLEKRIISRTRDLENARQILSDAVENISDGFSLWDSDDRLIMCNARYRAMYPQIADIFVPGLCFRDFIQALIDAELIERGNESAESVIDERLSRHRVSEEDFEHQLGDGRWVRVAKSRTGAGNVVGIVTDLTDRKQSEDVIRQMALEDSLTSLANRNQFHEQLKKAIQRSDRTGEHVGVMLLDLDRFKNVNDTLGHPAGDKLLQEVAYRLKECVRNSDSVARLGGDEFAVIAVDPKTVENVADIGARIVESISRPYDLNGHEAHIGTSVGITLYPEDTADADHLIKHADLALYRAKQLGRGNYQLYDEDLNAEVQSRRELERDLRLALDREELYMVYQPRISLDTRRTIGLEALVRWRHPEKGDIPPSEFIPLAEAVGLIVPLSEWLLEQVCLQQKEWERSLGRTIRVSVNMSPLHFQQANFTETMAELLARHDVAKDSLELEITEGIAMAGGEDMLHTLEDLKALGLGLEIDDFGTGYSSLSYLRQFPIDRLKIDRSFMNSVPDDADAVAICEAIIQLAHSLDLGIVAEGIENEAQANFLLGAGCDEAQGYYFAKPLLPEELHAHLAENQDAATSQTDRVPETV